MSSMNEAEATKSAKSTGPSPLHPRTRKGKTAKDRKAGAKQKNEQNKQARAAWQTDSKMSFPRSSCNGQRNRYQVTGKGGETTILGDKK